MSLSFFQDISWTWDHRELIFSAYKSPWKRLSSNMHSDAIPVFFVDKRTYVRLFFSRILKQSEKYIHKWFIYLFFARWSNQRRRENWGSQWTIGQYRRWNGKCQKRLELLYEFSRTQTSSSVLYGLGKLHLFTLSKYFNCLNIFPTLS